METHAGISPLGSFEDGRSAGLRAMARLKVGGSVGDRQKSLRRAVANLGSDSRYWPEMLAAGLADDAGMEAADAHVVALMCAYEACEGEVAARIREMNRHHDSEFTKAVISGLMAAAPEFGERLAKGRVNSDEILLRVALVRFFRRDPASAFQMFMMDAAVRRLARVFPGGVDGFVRACLQRFEEVPVPERATGYVVLLRDVTARAGFFVYPPTENARTLAKELKKKVLAELEPEGEGDAAWHHALAAAAYGSYAASGGKPEAFVPLMSILLEERGVLGMVVYVREDEHGFNSILTDIPGGTLEEVRENAVNTQEVRMHDQVRAMAEFMAQQKDTDERVKN